MTLINISKLAEKLGINPDSTIEQVSSFIDKLLSENNNLKSERIHLSEQIYLFHKREINGLLDACITSGKIAVIIRSNYESLFKKDFNTTKAIINAILPYIYVVSRERKDWTLRDWQVQDGKGLQDLKDNYSGAYKELYFKTIGKEPKY